MNGTTLLPWLLIGPTLVGVVAVLAYQATRIGAFRLVAQASLAVALAVIGLAFVANWACRDAASRRTRERAGRSLPTSRATANGARITGS
jgi:hypothetical protein